MTANYPKFQYSVFTRKNRDEQFVIRTETYEELKTAKKEEYLRLDTCNSDADLGVGLNSS